MLFAKVAVTATLVNLVQALNSQLYGVLDDLIDPNPSNTLIVSASC